MLYCYNCGESFDEYDAKYDRYWEGCDEVGAWMDYMVCPYCHKDEIGEADRCAYCGEWTGKEIIDAAGLCEDCSKKFEEAFVTAAKSLAREEPEFESVRDLFLDHIQDEYLGGL